MNVAASHEAEYPIIVTMELVHSLLHRPNDEPVAIIDSAGGNGFTAPLTAAVAFQSAWKPGSPPEARRSVLEQEGEVQHYLSEHEALLWQEARRRGLVLSGLVQLRINLPHSRAYVLVAQLTPSAGLSAVASYQRHANA